MELTPETRRSVNLVAGYSARELRLRAARTLAEPARELVLHASAIVTARHVLDWPVASVAALAPAALEPVYALGVEIVLLATGERQEFPSPAVIAAAAARGVGLEVMDLGAACRTYNVLVGEDRPVALAAVLPGAAQRPDAG
jgi:uncharacterized protein